MFRSRAIQAVYGTCPWRHAWSPRYHGFVNLSSDAGLRSTKGKAELLSAPSGGAACDQSLSLLLAHSLVPMTSRTSRPLPVPPGPVTPLGGPYHDNIYSVSGPYHHNLLPRPPYTALPVEDERPAATLRGGTLLHKSFYDLLALIPMPSPSRLLWGATADPLPNVVAGPRYEDLPDSNQVPPIELAPTSVSMSSTGPCRQ